ncbi:MAG: prephenate dehydratase domain-containing protein [Candidatus Margulisbacteria bacterium]|nr:prephenate dehydratase domain-containing protein [Candidatus Margulisiibacteriota bacterium]
MQKNSQINMGLEQIIAFGEKHSQTGNAFIRKFPDVPFRGNESFDDIHRILISTRSLATLPMWNSYQGEIAQAKILENVFSSKIKIHELWVKKIQFELITRNPVPIDSIKTVASVGVASTQCSAFLKGRDLKRFDSTTSALAEFKRNSSFDCVLCAPGACAEYFKAADNVSNPFNFTSFVLVGNIEDSDLADAKWEKLRASIFPKNNHIYGVEMPKASPTLTEEQQSFFEELTNEADSINDIPRIIFVYEQNPTKCGVLIETKGDMPSPSLNEDGTTKITMKENLGRTKNSYSDTAIAFLKETFQGATANDFYKHIGAKGYLYCCPSLNIIIHGFEEAFTEAISRNIISKYFELMDNGLQCTEAQKELFQKYKRDFYFDKIGFIEFIPVT